MVEVINNVSFKEALHFLLGTEAGVFDGTKVPKKALCVPSERSKRRLITRESI